MPTNRDERQMGDLGIVFGLIILAGTLGIIIGARLEWPLITIGVPTAGVVGYFLIGARWQERGISRTQFADSVYYLGFLFTLIAVLVSLSIFGTEGEYGFSAVVPQFGLALVTTIVGLAIRIYLVNFRPTAEDVVDRTDEAIAEAGQALRRRLEQLSVDMLAQNELMNRSLKEAVDTASSQLVGIRPESCGKVGA